MAAHSRPSGRGRAWAVRILITVAMNAAWLFAASASASAATHLTTLASSRAASAVTQAPVGDPLVGDWSVTYGNATVVTISVSGGVYTIKAKDPVLVTDGSCSLLPGTVIATFSGSSGTYSGQHGLWYSVSCVLAIWTPITLTLTGDTLTASFQGYPPVTFTRIVPSASRLTLDPQSPTSVPNGAVVELAVFTSNADGTGVGGVAVRCAATSSITVVIVTNANGYGVCRFSGRDESELATATALGPDGYQTTDPVPVTFGPRTEGLDQRAYQSTLLFPGHSVRLWRLNEMIGQTVHDEFGGGVEGTISLAQSGVSPGPIEGEPAMGLSTDGTVDFGNNVRPSAEEFTLEAYVKLSASAAGGVLFYNGSFELSVGDQGRLIADVVDNTGYAHVVSTTGSLTDDRWHHVAFTRTYHPGSDTRVKLYVDGRRVAQTEDKAATGGTSDAVLGGLDGAEIADLAFYRDVARTKQAIAASAALELSRPGFGQTKAPWRDLLATAARQRNEAKRLAPSTLGYYEQIINLVCAAARSTNKNCKSMEAATHNYESSAWAGDWIRDVFRRFLRSDSDPRAVLAAISRAVGTFGHVIEGTCRVFRVACGVNDFGTAVAGVDHFEHDLKPGFIQATRRALDEYGYGDRGELVQNLTAVLSDIREQHNGLFVNAVQPGFDAVHRQRLIGEVGLDLAQALVPRIAACFREQAFRQALRDKFGDALGDTYYLASGGAQYRRRYFDEGGALGHACQRLWDKV